MASESVPTWVIAVIAILVLVILVMALLLFVRAKRRSRSTTVDIADLSDKKHMAAGIPADDMPPSQQQKATQNTYSSSSFEPNTRRASQAIKAKPELFPPPPSTSLFSDKMELSSEEAMALFDKYVNAGLIKDNQKGLFSMDLERGGLAQLQQKAATIKSTFKQSLRRQKSTKSHNTPLDQLFVRPSVDTDHRSASSSTHPTASGHDTPSPSLLPAQRPNPLPAGTTDVSAHTIDNRTMAYRTPPMPSEPVADAYQESDNDGDDPALNAARRVIHTASRKSKSRSMLVNEEDVHQLFREPEQHLQSIVHPFATLRGNHGGGVRDKTVTITSGSVNRSVRDSTVAQRRAAFGVHRGSETRAQDIAGWWPSDNPSSMPRGPTGQPGQASYRGRLDNADDFSNAHRRPPLQGLFHPPSTTSPAAPTPQQAARSTASDNVDPTRTDWASTGDLSSSHLHSIRRMLQSVMTETDLHSSLHSLEEPRQDRSPDTDGPPEQSRQFRPMVDLEDHALQLSPAASFSSSTVHTVVPTQETVARLGQPDATQEKIEITDTRQFALLQRAQHRPL